MQFVVFMMTGFVVAVSSVSVTFLNADGRQASTFDEGDTVICRCRVDYTGDTPFDSARFVWRLYDSQDRVQVTEGDLILNQPDERDRFSGANLTDIGGSNFMDYRVTINGVDRYDNGHRLYCTFTTQSGGSTGAGGVAAKLNVNWNPPSAKCTDIAAEATKGDEVSYRCSAVDADAKSSGSLSLWKNGNQLAVEPDTAAATPAGTRYILSYDTKLTDDSAEDEFTCRYIGTGGYEEYNSNCTFNRPNCLVNQCPINGAETSRVQIVTTVGLPILVMYWIVLETKR